jgi:hypothetical protein
LPHTPVSQSEGKTGSRAQGEACSPDNGAAQEQPASNRPLKVCHAFFDPFVSVASANPFLSRAGFGILRAGREK